ncbi:unnamed protein product [Adineta steineri]|uniref:Uncharacterized protein n=1 Tax=Adineta steineri TaxID=433720 RepID=A0A815E1V1_9BILA|nr:unnamed protein product [Adineta steineri]CAF3674232.1 unnamed protein product [Adineta steineri]
MNERIHKTDQLQSSLSIETLQDIIRNYQRTEQRLQELERYTRHERKKAEHLLREKYRTNHEKPKQQQQSIEFFIPINNDNHSFKKINKKKILKEQQKTSTIDTTHRVRFDIPENHNIPINSLNEQNKNDDLDDLSRRCDDLLSRLKTDRNQRTILKNKDCNSYLQKSSSQPIDKSITLRQVLTFLRSSDPNILNEEINQVLKKKHEQPSTYNDELERSPISEIQRRNYLRTEILRIRLRQHHLLHSGTKIDDSLKMIDI